MAINSDFYLLKYLENPDYSTEFMTEISSKFSRLAGGWTCLTNDEDH